ncbi:MAG: polyamine aminopropyltransferase [Dehalococcoidia bacterium]|nr:polyamine aminopropyltransferase [Dehalococcoidia bacterium]
METGSGEWYTEFLTPHLSVSARIGKVLFSGKTAYQAVELLETPSLGRVLRLDGKTQSAELDEHVYHESLVHPAMLLHPAPRSVFIGGGGEGATAREVLRHGTVERVVMVDLDKELVELCREHLKDFHQGALDDPRLHLVFDDALKHLENTTDRFDVVVMDIADPLEGGPAHLLYTQETYRIVAERLNPGGVLVTQAGPVSMVNYREVHPAIHNTLETVFPTVASYAVHVQSFGEPWGFVLASDARDPRQFTLSQVDQRIRERGLTGLRFYDGQSHQGLFALPRYLREAIAAEERIITTDSPLFIF